MTLTTDEFPTLKFNNMKSSFYGKDLETLYNQRAVKVKRTRNTVLVEFVYKFNWTEDVKRAHPDFTDFCVRCIGKNALDVPFKAGAIKDGKHEGHWWFQYGPELSAVKDFIENPTAIYDLNKEDMVKLHML